MSGRYSRNKGYRFEAETVNLLKEHGLEAHRVPLSGATAHDKGDIRIRVHWQPEPLLGECKRRKALPQWIYDALGENDFLTMRGDRGESLTVIRTKQFAELCQ